MAPSVGQRLSSPRSDILLGYDAWSGPTDLAMLADLALGASVRAALGFDRRLATVSMTVQLDDVLPEASQLRVRAPRTSSTGEELALSGGSVLSALGQVGRGPSGRRPAAWPRCRGSGTRTRTGRRLRCRTSLPTSGARWTTCAAPLLANRAGVVQGGVLLGFSIHPAQLVASGPTELGEVVTARCAVLRPGRRTRLMRVDLHQAGRLVATTTVLLHSAG